MVGGTIIVMSLLCNIIYYVLTADFEQSMMLAIGRIGDSYSYMLFSTRFPHSRECIIIKCHSRQ